MSFPSAIQPATSRSWSHCCFPNHLCDISCICAYLVVVPSTFLNYDQMICAKFAPFCPFSLGWGLAAPPISLDNAFLIKTMSVTGVVALVQPSLLLA